MACRCIVFRILQAAADEGRIATNPVRRVRAPRKRVDPGIRFGRARLRALTPEECGRLLAASERCHRDISRPRSGDRPALGELLGLRVDRVNLAMVRIEVLELRGCGHRLPSHRRADGP